jgi:hypothetical protein
LGARLSGTGSEEVKIVLPSVFNILRRAASSKGRETKDSQIPNNSENRIRREIDQRCFAILRERAAAEASRGVSAKREC